MLRPADENETAVEKGGYVVSDNSVGYEPDTILIGTGSESEIAVMAGEELRKEGKAARVGVICLMSRVMSIRKVCFQVVVGARVRVEAGSTFGWEKIMGAKGKAIGIDRFGASAKAGRIYKEYWITVEAVIGAAKAVC
ncbi:unnamed protein product [Lactuca virosa]|uniref:Transketolase-like C-terminal domain-containing protein n=1 Tax=Lactuca virosa TaxID=75947 RepID=A0AAU9MWE2_9ASTR|nr:unnamed protein product [Lactuca virosa]